MGPKTRLQEGGIGFYGPLRETGSCNLGARALLHCYYCKGTIRVALNGLRASENWRVLYCIICCFGQEIAETDMSGYGGRM